ncbi:MAG: radical SAM protein [Patescibacteria group bacterium]
MPFFRENGSSGKPEIGIGIEILPEGECNLRCRQCFCEKKKPKINSFLSLDQIKFMIKTAARYFSELYVLGGEPTLRPDLKQILAFGLDHMTTVILVTNGLKLANERYCQSLALPGLSVAMHCQAISRDGRETVDYLARKNGTFDLAEKAWINVKKYWQGNICAQLNLLRPLVKTGHALDVFKWARSLGFEPIMELTKPGPIFERGHRLDVTAQEAKALYNEMLAYDRENYPRIAANFPAIVPPSYGHNCTLVETGLHIRIDGSVIPCIAHGSIILGNIFKDDLEKMLSSKIRLAIKDYRTWIVGPCRACAHFDYCHGGCRGEAFWDTGCPRASDPYCWHLPKGLTLKDMVPESCQGCLLENHPGCRIKI